MQNPCLVGPNRRQAVNAIVAAILVARKLSPVPQNSPAYVAAIADAVADARRIVDRVKKSSYWDLVWPRSRPGLALPCPHLVVLYPPHHREPNPTMSQQESPKWTDKAIVFRTRGHCSCRGRTDIHFREAVERNERCGKADRSNARLSKTTGRKLATAGIRYS